MVGWHHWLNGYEFEPALGDGEGQRSLGSQRIGHNWVTEQWTKKYKPTIIKLLGAYSKRKRVNLLRDSQFTITVDKKWTLELYICVCVCCICVQMLMYVWVYISKCLSYMYKYICIYTQIYIYTYDYVCRGVCVCVSPPFQVPNFVIYFCTSMCGRKRKRKKREELSSESYMFVFQKGRQQ